MKSIFGIFVIIFNFSLAFAQIQGDGKGIFFAVNAGLGNEIATVNFMQPDIQKLRLEDEINDVKGAGPWRFGYNHETSLTLENSGSWSTLANGGKVWRLKVASKYAQTINLTFNGTVIPKGNELYISSNDRSVVLGKFTENHLYKGELGSELVPGSSAIIEYYVAPENSTNVGQLEIVTVTHGYRTTDEFQAKAFGQAGACHMNVNCPDGLPFEQQKRSVVLIVSGSNGLCSGALINTTEYDERPYVLTANHCFNSNLANWVFRFNWESPNCSNPSTSPSYTSLSGASLLARKLSTDFCLLKITGGLIAGKIPSAYNVYFSGWDRSGVSPTTTFGIHHPRADIKKISFDDHASHPTQSTISGVTSEVNGVWQVTWDRNTTTESVSSGSPLFDQNRRIIGQLWGGGASCSSPTGNDFYGRIYSSWNPTASDSTNQLAYWLDPTSTGAIAVDGKEPSVLLANDGAIMHLKNVDNVICTSTISPIIRLANMGQTAMTAATIKYGVNGNLSETYNWTGNLSFLSSEELTFPPLSLSTSDATISLVLESVNGAADVNALNNTVGETFIVMENPDNLTFNLTMDCFPYETSWELKNQDGEIIYVSLPYSTSNQGLNVFDWCLDEGCYTLVVKDQYSDGMSGCASGNGSFQILSSANTVLLELTSANANFGATYEGTFCLGSASVKAAKLVELDVFPNPTTGNLNWTSDQVRALTVVDLNGKVVAAGLIKHGTFDYDLSHLENGFYVVQFELNDGQHAVSRLILSK